MIFTSHVFLKIDGTSGIVFSYSVILITGIAFFSVLLLSLL